MHQLVTIKPLQLLMTLKMVMKTVLCWTGQVCQILFHPSSLVHMFREENGPSKIQERIHLPPLVMKIR